MQFTAIIESALSSEGQNSQAQNRNLLARKNNMDILISFVSYEHFAKHTFNDYVPFHT
jgi:hypothetical protein